MLTKYQQATINRALKIMESTVLPKERYNSSSKLRSYLRLKLANEHNENFGVVFMNMHYDFLGYETLFTGSIHEAVVYPRVIMQHALKLNAARLVLAHNHPSGVAEPSEADKGLTDKLTKGFSLFDIKIIDHIIVSKTGTYSFAEEGLL